jgi:hypothetical protein
MPENDLYMSFTINCFIKKTQVKQSFSLQHARHELSLNGAAGLLGLDVDSLNSSRDHFLYLCIPGSKTSLH